MKSLKFNDSTRLYDQDILDRTINLMVKIFETSHGFGFRYVLYNLHKNLEIDPINHSEFNWAWGPFTTPEQAKIEARNYYRQVGIFQLKIK